VTPQTANAQTAAVPAVTDTGLGQVLIAPYYTVNGSWRTTVNLMNTSDRTLAVKARFREHKNSRDVLDFTIIMSPKDAWSGRLDDTPDGPGLITTDTTCTSPTGLNDGLPILLSEEAYTGAYDDNGGTGLGRMKQGYVEFILMGIAEDETTDIPTNAKHSDGVPVNCNTVDSKFVATEQVWTDGTNPVDGALYNLSATVTDKLVGSGNPAARDEFGAPEVVCAQDPNPVTCKNPLKGNVAWLNVGTGTGAGGAMIAVSDWLPGDVDLVTAQQFPWFLEPTLASSGGPATLAELWTVDQVVVYEDSIDATATLNEWANNPANGAGTEMVLTFPTKAYHVDRFNDQIQAAVSTYRNTPVDQAALVPIDPTTPTTIAPFEEAFNGESTITVSYDIYDREENSASFEVGTSVSPAPPVELEKIRFEANVINFGTAPILSSPTAASIDATALVGAPNGWVQVNFSRAGQNGLPVVGFVVKGRTLLEASSSYGQAMQNGYVRPAPAPAPTTP
jgi:hypothetical protein